MRGVSGSENQHTESCDFVCKLFQMLDDLELKPIVQWGERGDSFVIHDTEQFARVVLQKYFKHGNFASFVRQLNKYDFHKVRQNLDERSPNYNPEACEFRHTDFQKDRRDLLDRIKRKQPATRKHKTNLDYDLLAEQVDTITFQMTCFQQRIEQIDETCAELAINVTRMLNLVFDLSHELQIR